MKCSTMNAINAILKSDMEAVNAILKLDETVTSDEIISALVMLVNNPNLCGVCSECKKKREILSMSVDEIEMSVRLQNICKEAHISTIGELASKTEADLRKYRKFGKKCLEEVTLKLNEIGLWLGYKPDELCRVINR